MANMTYEEIQPLIHGAVQEGGAMRCTFKCPVTGTTVESQAGIQRGTGLADLAKQSVKRSLVWSIRSAILSAVSSVVGGGFVGRAARSVASQATTSATQQATSHSFSEDEKHAAVVNAFRSVSAQFAWDEKNKRWVSAASVAETLTDFGRQLTEAPVTLKYDRGVLARMLVETARADGTVTDEEQEFLAGFLSPEVGTVEDLLGREDLSAAELAETTSGSVRATMLMIAWGVALTDEELAAAEVQRLEDHAAGLGISEARAAELKRYAQCFLVDQALERAFAGGQRDEGAFGEAMGLAEKIGLAREDAERVEIRYRKRHGLV